MSKPQAAQQIGNLLTQSGVPAGISLDIAQRILTATGAVTGKSQASRTITSGQAKNSSFYNDFRPPEAAPKPTDGERRSKDGINGRDGRNGFFIPGSDGEDGKDGEKGDTGQGGAAGGGGFGGPIGIIPVYPIDLKPLWDAIRELQKRRQPEDCCEELRKRIAQMGRRIRKLEKKAKDLEKELDDAVEC